MPQCKYIDRWRDIFAKKYFLLFRRASPEGGRLRQILEAAGSGEGGKESQERCENYRNQSTFWNYF